MFDFEDLDPKEIGHRIRRAREECGLQGKELASRVRVYPSTISRYERGDIKKIKIPIIEAIAKVLRVNPMWLIGKSEYERTEDMLDAFSQSPNACSMNCTAHEKEILRKYRCLPAPVQGAVDAMIDAQYALACPRVKNEEEIS